MPRSSASATDARVAQAHFPSRAVLGDRCAVPSEGAYALAHLSGTKPAEEPSTGQRVRVARAAERDAVGVVAGLDAATVTGRPRGGWRRLQRQPPPPYTGQPASSR
jgi:hypothetical protein